MDLRVRNIGQILLDVAEYYLSVDFVPTDSYIQSRGVVLRSN